MAMAVKSSYTTRDRVKVYLVGSGRYIRSNKETNNRRITEATWEP